MLIPFSQFMTVKEIFDYLPWYEWTDQFRRYDALKMSEFSQSHIEIYQYYLITQFLFMQQWQNLKKYANQKGIDIIGDMPIYVSYDSAEMWETPELFETNEDHQPTFVAGTPPYAFASEGQYWGNPIYNWKVMKETNYDWWEARFKYKFLLL